MNLICISLYGALVTRLKHFKLNAMLSELFFNYLAVIQLHELLGAEAHRLYTAVLLLKILENFSDLGHDLSVNVHLKWSLLVERLLIHLSKVTI